MTRDQAMAATIVVGAVIGIGIPLLSVGAAYRTWQGYELAAVRSGSAVDELGARRDSLKQLLPAGASFGLGTALMLSLWAPGRLTLGFLIAGSLMSVACAVGCQVATQEAFACDLYRARSRNSTLRRPLARPCSAAFMAALIGFSVASAVLIAICFQFGNSPRAELAGLLSWYASFTVVPMITWIIQKARVYRDNIRYETEVELNRRSDDIRSGRVKPMTWDDIEAQLHTDQAARH